MPPMPPPMPPAIPGRPIMALAYMGLTGAFSAAGAASIGIPVASAVGAEAAAGGGVA